MKPPLLRAALFDKDGTLFDFTRSWGAWTRAVLADLAPAPEAAAGLARVLGFDPASGAFAEDSPIIAHTTFEIADIIADHLRQPDSAALHHRIDALAHSVPMVPAADLHRVLRGLRAQGLATGVATNDTEGSARAHLRAAGILPLFDFIAGCDSGHGGKPAPGQLLAFAGACGLAPQQIVMVGDSVHDMVAGRRAGMACVAVLTGIAGTATLQPHADAVLADISGLGGWIAARNAAAG